MLINVLGQRSIFRFILITMNYLNKISTLQTYGVTLFGYTNTQVSDISNLVVVESYLFSVIKLMIYTHPGSSSQSNLLSFILSSRLYERV